jgi:hypothetical protein
MVEKPKTRRGYLATVAGMSSITAVSGCAGNSSSNESPPPGGTDEVETRQTPSTSGESYQIHGSDQLPTILSKQSHAPIASGDSQSVLTKQSTLTLPQNESQIAHDNYTGRDDLSYSASLTYDSEALHLDCTVTDESHHAIAGPTMWRGDGLQIAFEYEGTYGPEIGLTQVDGEPSVQLWHVPDSITVDKDAIDLQTSSTSDGYRCRATLPWSDVLGTTYSASDTVRFGIIVNDNDGDGREGYIQWTPVIGENKQTEYLGTLDLVPTDRSWTAWITGPDRTTGSTETQFTLYLVNLTEDTMDVSLSSLGEPVSLPGGEVLSNTIQKSFSDMGETTVAVDVAASGTSETISHPLTVIPGANELRRRFDTLESDLPALEQLLERAEKNGHAVEYERVSVQTIEQFISYGRRDIENDKINRARYVVEEINSLYETATKRLESYLAGDQKGNPVPRYQTGDIAIDGPSFRGTKKVPSTGETLNDEPIFFHGSWPFNDVKEKLRKFPDFGANVAHLAIAPWEWLRRPASGLQGLTEWTNESGNISYQLSDSVAHSGSQSLKITGSDNPDSGLGLVSKAINVDPDSTYVCEAYVKGQNVGEAFFRTGWKEFDGEEWHYETELPSGTFDWQKVTFEVTTASDQTEFSPRIALTGPSETVWVDDVVVHRQGNDANLFTRGGFEGSISAEDKERGFVIKEDVIKQQVEEKLEICKQNNIAVNYTLQPHGMPGWVFEKWPEAELAKEHGGHFNRFKIDHPKMREILEAHFTAATELLKDHDALHSINLTNEPAYKSTVDKYSKRQWASFLEETYDSIDELNQVYGSDHATFDAVTFPENVHEPKPEPRYYDWFVFNTQRFADWHEWLADIVKSVDPDVPVHSKIMGKLFDFGPGDQYLDWMYRSGFDAAMHTDFSEINGYDDHYYADEDIFNKDGDLRYMQYKDYRMSLKEAPGFNTETHIIRNGGDDYTPAIAKHVRTAYWQAAIHGANAQAMWLWEREESTTLDLNVVNDSLFHRPDCVATLGKTSLDLNRLMPEVTAFQKSNFDVRILFSNPSLIYSGDDHMRTMNEVYETLTLSGVKTGFVRNEQLANGEFSGADVIVVPNATHIDPAILEPLAAFAEENTVVVLGEESLRSDPRNRDISGPEPQRVHDGATSIAPDVGRSALRKRLTRLLESAGVKQNHVEVSDGKPATTVEWQTVEYEGQTLLNLVNYGDLQKTVRVRGALAGREAHDILNGESVDLSALTLPTNDPKLIRAGE